MHLMLLHQHVNTGIVPGVNTVMPAALQTSKPHGLHHDGACLYLAPYTEQEVHQLGIV